MDGEHAFSASLTLVMVNVAFPYNERDAKAMEVALSVLRSMAVKGNEYIQARLALLMNLRSSIGPRPPTYQQQTNVPVSLPTAQRSDSSLSGQYASLPLNTTLPMYKTSPQFDTNFQPLEDLSLDLNTEDDPQFWEEIRNINMDMDSTGWIEDTLRNGGYQFQQNM